MGKTAGRRLARWSQKWDFKFQKWDFLAKMVHFLPFFEQNLRNKMAILTEQSSKIDGTKVDYVHKNRKNS